MIKDILVHLDGSAEDEIRLEHAQALASALHAHVSGVLTNELPDLTVSIPMDGSMAAVQAFTELEEKARKDGDATVTRLTERLAALQMPSELRRLDDTLSALSARLAVQARCADLLIATRPYGQARAPDWSDLVEAVLFGSGRALLLVPPGGHPRKSVQTVLIAWNGSRESARAVREGLEFIDQGARAVILVVDPPPEIKLWAELEAHLKRHGVSAEIIAAESQGRRIADVIRDEARRLSADLIILGAYSHTRLRERVFGGVTRDMLATSEVPLLVAH